MPARRIARAPYAFYVPSGTVRLRRSPRASSHLRLLHEGPAPAGAAAARRTLKATRTSAPLGFPANLPMDERFPTIRLLSQRLSMTLNRVTGLQSAPQQGQRRSQAVGYQ
ncbi:hypothetical protein CO2235_MP20201 [Cupriavidus oxalaticus]|uniref:Uncharacterized protein n=1 Tax=Cupriavidus oxalaticus TaxID=96344 RepID=A0A976GCD8_9BURK|nr:hypothetical protein CO2235_MP20201 [Cupriavidus oxalaticus]